MTKISGTVGFEVLRQELFQDDFVIAVIDGRSKRSEEKSNPFKYRMNLIFSAKNFSLWMCCVW
ncbi:hypothetical protein ESY86_04045 [Subsaximicrobium wynnwilliamsii]|uniref:Uncharacterized protein n=1 Tax=Subsaximicrobium wynnwilliamsii TaxID=291179 RepID=A0A5C6ZMB8_9FLAO|nr:hypothetical protein [Subsaximicrobium wynnwilliamsii]TXD84876.1 hypothetical protein ESY87_03825 [Subsaximicrobium wynnwilliamsii]TXD90547.1 hypothetical protein ESY86_04045 [Subsaximicrobium wynnwilliamsii]TXE05022.1 hypothetical protein ESY88_02350 [Subsaximicrobium wynnwilliamsii]